MKRITWAGRVLGAAALLCSFSAHATWTLEEYAALRLKQPLSFLAMLAAGGEALTVANMFLETRNQAPLFCTPRNLSLNGADYQNILETYLVKRAGNVRSSYPVNVALLWAMQETFPCLDQR